MITSIFADLDKVFGDLQNAIDANSASYSIETNEDGDIILRKKKVNEDLIKLRKEIQDYIDEIDDEIFTSASASFEKSDKDSYEILANYNNVDNIESLKNAFNSFKVSVKAAVETRIKAIETVSSSRIKALKDQYGI